MTKVKQRASLQEECTLHTLLKRSVSTSLPFFFCLLFHCVTIWFCYYSIHVHTFLSLDQKPTLPELLELKIPLYTSTDYKKFGTFLLIDETGSRVNSIEEEFRGKPERISTHILEEWLAGRGKPCTWQILIKTLRDCDFNVLADQIQKTKI